MNWQNWKNSEIYFRYSSFIVLSIPKPSVSLYWHCLPGNVRKTKVCEAEWTYSIHKPKPETARLKTTEVL